VISSLVFFPLAGHVLSLPLQPFAEPPGNIMFIIARETSVLPAG
jgi:hypothetical protein